MVLAALLDTAFGWPERLYARIGHPVTWIGTLIDRLRQAANHGAPARRRVAGILTVAVVLAAAMVPAAILPALLPDGPVGWVLIGLLAWPFVAARSLHEHVAAVAAPLTRGDLAGARAKVAMIVGRDPARLNEGGIARASIESLAENASDGVVAPLFWGVLLGLPGIAGYKALNTMDSMIGHRTLELQDFGRAAARLDDLANLIPARITGLLFALVSGAPRRTVAAMRRDAPRHRSPNAGWPEAAMATALGVRLSGPRLYAEGQANEPWLNADAPDPGAAQIDQALRLFRRAMALWIGALALVALA